MRLLQFIKNNKVGILSMLLMVLATAFGADASMAMADAATEAANAATATGSTADHVGESTQLTGTAASGTQARDGELTFPEIDEQIAKFAPYKFTLDTDVRMKARQQAVKGYEIKHYRVGTAVLDYETVADITNATSASALDIAAALSAEAKKSIAKDQILYFDGVAGYDAEGVAYTNGLGLHLIVTDKTSTSIVVEAIDGPVDNSGARYVPDVEEGAHFSICSNALSESQMHCEPENFQPRPHDVYLQKRACNIVITDHWKDLKKQVPFVENDIREDALYKFKRKKERELWIGVKSKQKRYQGGTLGDEYVYTSEGILAQVINTYQYYNGILTYADLIALTKMQFTENSESGAAVAYCGKNFMERLLNIDFTKHKDITFQSKMELGIDIKSFQTTFGKIDFKWNPSLDDIGLSDDCIILDMEHAVRYYKDNKDYSVDMKKGAGENREAKRDIHIEVDAVALKGYNSIWVKQGAASDEEEDAGTGAGTQIP